MTIDKKELSIINKEQQALDLNSDDDDVRIDAVKLGGLSKEQQEKALNDKDWYVRRVAV